jgi:signal transduction histidine kinase
MQITLYRVIQEALTNVAKHAKATTQVTITLSHVNAMLRLVIEDDGQGFDAEREVAAFGSQGSGLGLVGIRERLSLAGGELEIESVPGVGTTIFVRLPFESTAIVPSLAPR